jgi:hypothetical protein
MTVSNGQLLTLEEQAASDAFKALRVLQHVTMTWAHVVPGFTSMRLTMEADEVSRMATEVSRLLDLTRQEIQQTTQPKKRAKKCRN